MSERTFPVLNDPELKRVPWSLVAPFQKRAERNHSQTLDRLAQRGGLDPFELFCLLSDRGLFEKPYPAPIEDKAFYRAWVKARISA